MESSWSDLLCGKLKLREKHDFKKKIDFGKHAAVTTPNLNTMEHSI